MNLAETAGLVGYLRKAKPSMNLGIAEETAREWAPILEPYTAHEVRFVVDKLLAEASWPDLATIVQGARRARRARLAAADYDLVAPNVDPDNPTVWIAERRALRDAIASGRWTPDELAEYAAGERPTLTGAPRHITAGQLKRRDMRALTATTKRADT